MTESIIFAGTPANAAATLRALLSAGVEVELVITRKDAPTGRKGLMTASPVAMVAQEHSIGLIKANSFDYETIERLRASRSQLAIVVAFGVILKKDALESLSRGWFNLHYSLLPAYRGAAPVQHALLQGEAETGVTLFRLDEGLDTGPIVAQVATLVHPSENSADLLLRLTELGSTLLIQEIPKLFSSLEVSLSDQKGRPSYAPKLNRADGRLDFSKSATYLSQQIAACTPEPGAWCELDGSVLKISSARALGVTMGLAPGETRLIGGRIVSGCANSSLELLEVHPAGKNAMTASSWFRGKQTDVRLT